MNILKKENWMPGDTVTYPHDYGFSHLIDIPFEVAIKWLKIILPDHKLSPYSENKIKDIDIPDWEKDSKNDWLNKLLIVIDMPHVGEVIGLYNHDGKISIRFLDLKKE
jgi:hypothetical protein